MATALLIIIYIAFIGLGLPHSLFGAVWPEIQREFGVSIDFANYVTLIISGCTVASAMLGARITNKFGTARVVSVSTFLAAIALLGFSFSGNLVAMCFFAIPLGLSAGATDAALNNYIALNYSAMHMNFLHCFYGVGVMTSPYLMSVMLKNYDWHYGYRVIFLIQLSIALIILITLPLWKKNGGKDKILSEGGINLSYLKMIKMPSIRLYWLMCISINAIEGVAGIWASSFLISAYSFDSASAAGTVTLFYIGIALGRFLAGILSEKMSGWSVIKWGTVIMGAGIIMMFIPNPIIGIFGLFLTGLGNGPVYPTIMYLTPRNFGEEYSGSVIGSQMAAAYFGIMVAPPVFGFLADKINAGVYPHYISVWSIIFIISTFLFIRRHKKTAL